MEVAGHLLQDMRADHNPPSGRALKLCVHGAHACSLFIFGDECQLYLSSLGKPSFLHTIHVPCKRISEFLPINFHIEPDWNQNLRLGCILMDDCWVVVIKANKKSNNTVYVLENDTSGILHRKKKLFVGNNPHPPTPQSLDRLLRTGVQSSGIQQGVLSLFMHLS